MKLGTRLLYVLTHRRAIFDRFHGGDLNLQCLNVLVLILQSFDGFLQARNAPGQECSAKGVGNNTGPITCMLTRNRNQYLSSF